MRVEVFTCEKDGSLVIRGFINSNRMNLDSSIRRSARRSFYCTVTVAVAVFEIGLNDPACGTKSSTITCTVPVALGAWKVVSLPPPSATSSVPHGHGPEGCGSPVIQLHCSDQNAGSRRRIRSSSPRKPLIRPESELFSRPASFLQKSSAQAAEFSPRLGTRQPRSRAETLSAVDENRE
jgi:hypothetical protein